MRCLGQQVDSADQGRRVLFASAVIARKQTAATVDAHGGSAVAALWHDGFIGAPNAPD
jgi:hypothetical protein